MIAKIKEIINKYWRILKDAANGFSDDKGMKLSSALAYSTIFSLPPMLLLIIVFAGTFYGKDAVEGKVFIELRRIFDDSEIALQIQDVIRGLQKQRNSTMATIIGSIALIIGSTGIFVEIQDSLNMIWGVRPRAKKGIIKFLLNRVISFSMIIGLGFLLIVSLIINALLIALSSKLVEWFPGLPLNLLNFINSGLIFLVLSFLFSVIFKMLPDVRIRWKQVWPGSIVTAGLFLVGKFVIGIYISQNKTVSLYGTASSIIILLLWIYFSSAILYFGAEFTRAYIEYHGKRIVPNSYAEYSDKRILKHLREDETKEKT
ncbi:YihY/virulence factor BrkB family protein [Taibaiella lutea]|uniref:YihY/virulence factor BrkB family protein n=1 Tax=Taibaiella lutea TaxID=2608001 RepID=A0A5M6CSS1_9BACT|nr:YihY/virulence factor BrkB family protein [Taibaiella lutea]KAA5536209.1 YihY/virulence factor BrkB family protein [Taibaiella lutea]